MPRKRRKKGGDAVFVALLLAAVACGVLLSIVPRRSVASGGAAGSSGDTTSAATPGKNDDPWSQFRPGPEIMVRAEDAAGLAGAMTLEEGPDNRAPGKQPSALKYVWCADAGQPEMEPEESTPAADYARHRAVFNLTVPEGRTYYPWVRVWWQDSCGNSITLRLEREDEPEREFVVQDDTKKSWHWLPVTGDAGLGLRQGLYVLTVQNREDGARVHCILFSSKSYQSYKPETPEG